MTRPRGAARLVASLLLGLALWPGGAHADPDGHYQDTLIGERAAGMGGAFTAIASEATGAYHNPAGIAVEASTLLQLSVSAYKFRRKSATVAEICGAKLDEDDGGFFGFPAALGFVKPWQTGSVRHALGLTVAVPYADKVSQAVVQQNINCAGNIQIDDGVSRLGVDRVLTAGLTYAIQPLRWLRMGATLGAALRDASITRLSTVVLRNAGLDDPGVDLAHLDVAFWALFFQFGAIVEPLPGWTVGVSITTPYLELSGGGRIDLASAVVDPAQWQNDQILLLDDADFNWKVPTRIALGVAYQRPSLVLAADVSINLPVDRFTVVSREPELPAGITDERELVVNVNLGVEVALHRAWLVRGGLFTNLSSAPKLDPLVDEDGENVDYFGASTGLTYRSADGSTLSLSVQAQLGIGEVLTTILRGSNDPSAPLVSSVEPRDLTAMAMIIGVGGSYDLR